MEQRLSIITLGVRDLERARRFYESLGWQKVSKEEEIAAFDLNGFTFALYPRAALAKEIPEGGAVQNEGHPPFTLAYNVSSEQAVEVTLEEAVRAGARLIKPAEKVFWGGYSGYFSDPDGFLWEVAYNPFSQPDAQGHFRWNG